MNETPRARTFRTDDAGPPTRAARSRREHLRAKLGREARAWGDLLLRPDRLGVFVIAALFAAVAGVVVGWGRSSVIEEAGRIADRTRLVRQDFEIQDIDATDNRRDIAKAQTPRVYVADQAWFQLVERSLEQLPTALADAETLEKVAPPIREQFGLTQQRLDAVRRHVVEGEADQAWAARVRAFITRLRATPIIDREAYQLEQQQAGTSVELRAWDAPPRLVLKGDLVNLDSDQLRSRIRACAVDAGFPAEVGAILVERLAREPKALYTLSTALTEEARTAAAAAVQPVMVRYPKGRVIVAKGERLTEDGYLVLLQENDAHARLGPRSERIASWAGAMALAALVTAGGSGYIRTFFPPTRRRAVRMVAVAALLAITLAAAVVAGVYNPGRLTLVSLAPIVFCAMILAIVYDQRTSFALAGLHAVLVAGALQQGLGFFIAAVAGAGVAIWRLKDVRHRNTLIFSGALAGVAMAAAVCATALVETTASLPMLRQTALDAVQALLGGLLVGFVTLGLLPAVERAFGVVTGLTLIELRDPKHPLLRELQQRAPGTYSHSLTVATLAESAADAIGADGLHVYVGAMYHDIGKMNKPDYFVENQTGAFSRHSKLSPAMSLLVIVGHVKDGLELAREHALPRSLHHYIESHHGTTLVEYFYHAARKRAGDADTDEPSEIEYRYPGPKPRTKEAAILMICDATEGASRAMSDPTPARIEALVHDIAHKRLDDGQFDECELTMRELSLIEASVVKTLSSIYHGRIAYPSQAQAPAQPITGLVDRPRGERDEDDEPRSQAALRA